MSDLMYNLGHQQTINPALRYERSRGSSHRSDVPMSTSDHTSDPNPRKCFGIYLIRNLATGWVYVGSTTQYFSYRWRQHIKNLKDNEHNNPYLQHSWNYWGPIWFRFEIAEVLTSKEIVIEREQAAADRLRAQGVSLYNTNEFVGNPMQGKHHTEETKEKIRAKATGRKLGKTWNKGVPHTAETRRKLSEAGRGRKIPPDQLARRIGRKNSEETLARMRASAKRGSENPACRPDVRAKIGKANKARHNDDDLSPTALKVLSFLSRSDEVLQSKRIEKGTDIPSGSLPRTFRKLLRLGYIERDTTRRYRGYKITDNGIRRLAQELEN